MPLEDNLETRYTVTQIQTAYNYAEFTQYYHYGDINPEDPLPRFSFNIYFREECYKDLKIMLQHRFGMRFFTDQMTNSLQMSFDISRNLSKDVKKRCPVKKEEITLAIKYFVDPSSCLFDPDGEIEDDQITTVGISRKRKSSFYLDFESMMAGIDFLKNMLSLDRRYSELKPVFDGLRREVNLQYAHKNEQMMALTERLEKIKSIKQEKEAEELWYSSNTNLEFANFYIKKGDFNGAKGPLRDALVLNRKFHATTGMKRYKEIANEEFENIRKATKIIVENTYEKKKNENKNKEEPKRTNSDSQV
jgi:hypothetical protein